MLENDLCEFEASQYFNVKPPRPLELPEATSELRQHIAVVSVKRQGTPLGVDAMLPPVTAIIRDAPYLLSAQSHFLVLPHDERHQALRTHWARAAAMFGDN